MKIHKYDSEIPAVEEIGHNLFKIVLPQPFYAPNNIYILNGEQPALIDSGFILNLGLLQRAMKKINLPLSKIQHIFYTHNHLCLSRAPCESLPSLCGQNPQSACPAQRWPWHRHGAA